MNTAGQVRELIEGMLYLLQDPKSLIGLFVTSLAHIGGYLIVAAIFVAFVVANGGIAVGDKLAHSATFHPTQVRATALFQRKIRLSTS